MPNIRSMGKDVMIIDVPTSPSWITLIKEYIEHKNLPTYLYKATLVKKMTNRYTIIRGTLYKRGLYIPLLRCLEKAEASYTLLEIHECIIT